MAILRRIYVDSYVWPIADRYQERGKFLQRDAFKLFVTADIKFYFVIILI